MNKNLITIAIAACTAFSAFADNYKVTLPLTEDEDGMKAYICNFDNGTKIDSTVVENGKAVFSGSIETPVFAELILEGRKMILVLEPGNATFDTEMRSFTGTPLNDKLVAYFKKQQKLASEYRNKTTTPERQEEIISEYDANAQKMLDDNIDNPIGFMLFTQKCAEWDLQTLNDMLQKHPQFASSERINKVKKILINKEQTSEGKKFKDFEVSFDGKTSRLSDYVGKGKYTIVDFWASWCGPCIRQAKVLKELYAKYADKGLDFLGVAVWDEPQNTIKAIKDHDLPWPQILNAQTIPTDIYGIQGIPCIILFDPEGNIISRDKQNEDLINDVTKAMEGK